MTKTRNAHCKGTEESPASWVHTTELQISLLGFLSLFKCGNGEGFAVIFGCVHN